MSRRSNSRHSPRAFKRRPEARVFRNFEWAGWKDGVLEDAPRSGLFIQPGEGASLDGLTTDEGLILPYDSDDFLIGSDVGSATLRVDRGSGHLDMPALFAMRDGSMEIDEPGEFQGWPWGPVFGLAITAPGYRRGGSVWFQQIGEEADDAGNPLVSDVADLRSHRSRLPWSAPRVRRRAPAFGIFCSAARRRRAERAVRGGEWLRGHHSAS